MLGNVSEPSAPATGTVLAPSVTVEPTGMAFTMTATGRPGTRLLLYLDGQLAGPTLKTSADGTASQDYLWTGAPGTYRLGFGYDFGDRHGIVVDLPITLSTSR